MESMEQQESGSRVLITGAGGMIGQKLAISLANSGRIGSRPITHMTLADLSAPPGPVDSSVDSIESVAVDIARPGTAEALVASRPDVIFHLAAVVSGEAELEFEKGYAVNLDASRWLLDAVRSEGAEQAYQPRFVYASSNAVFGSPFPDRIGDDFRATPATSYGSQKAMVELLINDYSRRGILDGISLRLPAICIRPGSPNKAASGFFSDILREPLAGLPARLPVSESVRHTFASPRAAVGFFEHAAAMNTAPLGVRRALNMPGLSVTVAEQIVALRRFAGQDAVDLIRSEPDPLITEIVDNWPHEFDPQRAKKFGFVADSSFDDIIRAHLEDEHGA